MQENPDFTVVTNFAMLHEKRKKREKRKEKKKQKKKRKKEKKKKLTL